MLPSVEREGLLRDGSASATADRDIWAMAWPAMLSFVLTNIVDLVDIAMVGRLGSSAVAAVGYAAQVVNLIRTVVMASGIACVALMSRSVGARQLGRASQSLAGSLVVALGIALLGALVVCALPRAILETLHAEPDVVALAVPYFRLSAAATVLLAASVTFESAHRSQRSMRTPLMIAAVAATVKISSSALLIFGALGLPRLELVGAGLGTLMAESVALALYFTVGRFGTRLGLLLLPAMRDFRAGISHARDVLRVASPAIAERLVLNLALLAYFAILADYGTAAIAAYAIGVRLLAFSWLPGQGFAAAAATLVGQTLGAGDALAARSAGWRSVRLALAVMALLALGCAFLREPLARVFTHDPTIIAQLLPFLLMLAVAQPFMGVHFTLAGALRGAGDTATPLIGAAVGNWLLRVPVAWFAAEVLHVPIIWVWASLVLDHVARAVWYVFAFRSGRWAKKVVV